MSFDPLNMHKAFYNPESAKASRRYERCENHSTKLLLLVKVLDSQNASHLFFFGKQDGVLFYKN